MHLLMYLFFLRSDKRAKSFPSMRELSCKVCLEECQIEQSGFTAEAQRPRYLDFLFKMTLISLISS